MELITERSKKVYDTSGIQPGDLMYAKHRTWTEGRGGFVTAVTDERLTVQYHPGIGNVTNHFFIPVEEVIGGEWEIRWSADMTEIWEYEAKSIGGS